MAPVRNISKTFQALIIGESVSPATAYRHANGHDTMHDKVGKMLKLDRQMEECLAGAWLKIHEAGELLHFEMLKSVVQRVVQWQQPSRVVTFDKNWPQRFIRRHSSLGSNGVRLHRFHKNKERFANEDSMVDEVKSQLKDLQERAISSANIWRVIVTTVSLGGWPLNINSLDDADDALRNLRYKGSEMITAIECINKAGKALDPLILWPSGTFLGVMAGDRLGSGWKHARWGTGYFDTKARARWLQDVFNPATLSTESSEPRILLVGAWADYRDSIKFCGENGITIVPASSSKGSLHWGPQTITSELRKAFGDAAEGGKNLGRKDFIHLYHSARERAMSCYGKLDEISESGNSSLLCEDIKTPWEQATSPEDVLMPEWKYTVQKCTGSEMSLYDRIMNTSAFKALHHTIRTEIEDFARLASEAVECCRARGCVH